MQHLHFLVEIRLNAFSLAYQTYTKALPENVFKCVCGGKGLMSNPRVLSKISKCVESDMLPVHASSNALCPSPVTCLTCVVPDTPGGMSDEAAWLVKHEQIQSWAAGYPTSLR